MKAEVWTLQGYEEGRGRVNAKRVWVGEVDFLPVKGTRLILHEGGCSEIVKDVHYDLAEKNLYIEIHAIDWNDEYKEV